MGKGKKGKNKKMRTNEIDELAKTWYVCNHRTTFRVYNWAKHFLKFKVQLAIKTEKIMFRKKR